MSGVNLVVLRGNLGADPEVKKLNGNGQSVCNFRLATNETWTDKEGRKGERTDWHRIVVWGKLAELCGEHLKKGEQAYVEGRLQCREYEKNGEKHWVTEVVATSVLFLGRPKRSTAEEA
jgi:single-strand DNA-binding protein